MNASQWTRLAVVVPAVVSALAITAVRAEDFFQLLVDRTQTITAQSASVQGGYVDIVLPQAPGRPLRLPVERVACLTATNCPQQLAELAQAATAGSLPKAAAGFQIYGSNTIGAELMPRLIEEYLRSRQTDPQTNSEDVKEPGREGKRHTIKFDDAVAPIEINAFGSTTGFAPLRDGQSQLWMASRAAKKEEVADFKARNVDLLAADSEHVIALDGLAVIVHRDNPIGALSLKDIADIFSGKVDKWDAVPGSNLTGAIKVIRRDDNSGTTSTFKDLVLDKLPFAASAKPIGDSTQLEAEVAGDVRTIGFVGLGYVVNTKAVAIKVPCGKDFMAYKPDSFLIKTEEYPLSRRLFIYSNRTPVNELARDVLSFTTSPQGQKVIQDLKFVDLLLDAKGREFDAQGGRLANMLVAGGKDDAMTRAFIGELRFARRISTTLRFKERSDELDNKAVADLDQLAEALKNNVVSGDWVVVGFADDVEEKDGTATDISQRRAVAVANALQAKSIKVYKNNVKWFGSAAPAVCNSDDRNRSVNRRVEVWLR